MDYKRVVCDSREVTPGDLFFALKGEKVDGHDFVGEAFSKGAIGAFVEKEVAVSGPLYIVDSPLQVLQDLAKKKIKEKNPKVIAITGSVGKTTTKEFITCLLSKKFSVAKSKGNYNSKVGLPITILNDFSDQEILVLEMGMTEAGHIKELVEIAPPDIALITSIALVHACNFEGIEEIAKAKAEIFSHPKTTKRFAHQDTLQYLAINQFSPDSFGGDFVSPLPYPLNQSALGAIAIARYLGVDEELINQGLRELKAVDGRGNLVEKSSIFFYNDAYNASEMSMVAALEQLNTRIGRKVAVLGQMLELGKFSEESHRRVGDKAAQVADLVICLGSESLPLYEVVKKRKEAYFFLKREELLECLKTHLCPNDHVLLKGSNGNQLWRVLDDFSIV